MSKVENIGTCPGCGRHCSLNAPHCPRGEAFAKSGELPARDENPPRMHGNHGERHHSDLHGHQHKHT